MADSTTPATACTRPDTIIIGAQFDFTPAISMPGAAAATIRTAGLYGSTAKRAVSAAFVARGLA